MNGFRRYHEFFKYHTVYAVQFSWTFFCKTTGGQPLMTAAMIPQYPYDATVINGIELFEQPQASKRTVVSHDTSHGGDPRLYRMTRFFKLKQIIGKDNWNPQGVRGSASFNPTTLAVLWLRLIDPTVSTQPSITSYQTVAATFFVKFHSRLYKDN